MCDVDAIETAMTEGIGMWYAFFGPFEMEHINAEGKKEKEKERER